MPLIVVIFLLSCWRCLARKAHSSPQITSSRITHIFTMDACIFSLPYLWGLWLALRCYKEPLSLLRSPSICLNPWAEALSESLTRRLVLVSTNRSEGHRTTTPYPTQSLSPCVITIESMCLISKLQWLPGHKMAAIDPPARISSIDHRSRQMCENCFLVQDAGLQ